MGRAFYRQFTRAIGLFLLSAGLLIAAAGAARGETAYAVDLDGAQAGTNSAAAGFGAIVVNDAETRGMIHLKFGGLSAVPDFNSGVAMRDANGTFLRWIPLAAQQLTQVYDYSLAAGEAAKMRQGKIFVEILTTAYPNGEIRGQVRPYSPFITRLRPNNSNPPGDPNGDGCVLVVLNKDETDGVLYYRYAGLSQTPSLVSFDLFVISSPGALFAESMRFLSQFLTVDAEFVARLKRGRQTFRISANLATQLQGTLKPVNKDVDFNGDVRADLAVFRPSEGMWYWQNSLGGQVNYFQFGSSASIPVPADYDGDGRTDYAVWLPGNGVFYVWNVFSNAFHSVQWGKAGDVPVPADYDGDGKTDFAVYRAGAGGAQSFFWVLKSTGGSYAAAFGLGEDRPLVGDFDGDRASDLTVWRPSSGTFYSLLSRSGAVRAERWGIATDIPLVADFDADALADYAVYRKSGAEAGRWYVANNAGGTSVFHWGTASDVPVPADYDGDGKADYAVFRSGSWFISGSAGLIKTAYFGTGGDVPLSAR